MPTALTSHEPLLRLNLDAAGARLSVRSGPPSYTPNNYRQLAPRWKWCARWPAVARALQSGPNRCSGGVWQTWTGMGHCPGRPEKHPCDAATQSQAAKLDMAAGSASVPRHSSPVSQATPQRCPFRSAGQSVSGQVVRGVASREGAPAPEPAAGGYWFVLCRARRTTASRSSSPLSQSPPPPSFRLRRQHQSRRLAHRPTPSSVLPETSLVRPMHGAQWTTSL